MDPNVNHGLFDVRMAFWTMTRHFCNSPLHENLVGLRNLALPQPVEDKGELERVCRFLIPTPRGEETEIRTPHEPSAADQLTTGMCLYMFTISLFLFNCYMIFPLL